MPKDNQVLAQVAEWQSGKHLVNQDAVQGPVTRTLVWEAQGVHGVAIITKAGDQKKGHFVDFKIDERNPFRTVVANVKRAYTRDRKKLGEALC
ncbi:hypothetical protein [Azonexus hydrophilus]|uniref:Uncharacterized protein n=1 Tax=Azonexus hydrophilus TaxID=418702 RepID=A0ABZ2XLP1_9RHOO